MIRPSGSLKSTKTGSEVSAMLTLPAESRTMSRMKTRNGRFGGSIQVNRPVLGRLEAISCHSLSLRSAHCRETGVDVRFLSVAFQVMVKAFR